MFCAKCGAKLEENAKFCAKCGNPMAAVSSPAAGAIGMPWENESAAEQGNESMEAAGKKKRGRGALTALLALMLILAAGAGGYHMLHRETGDAQEDTAEENSRTEAEESSEAEGLLEMEEQPDEKAELMAVFESISYYGDKSRCAMTAEQAAAYARLIVDGRAGDFSFRDGYDENRFTITSWDKPFQVLDFDMGEQVEEDRYHVMLCDFAGDGVPYLYVCSSTNDIDNPSFEIYGWADHAVKLVYDTDAEKSFRNSFILYEDEGTSPGVLMDVVVYQPPEMFYYVRTYAFAEGTVNAVCERTEELNWDEDVWHVIENGAEMIYTEEEYSTLTAGRHQAENHNHTLPYTCFHEMQPSSLSNMQNGLNQYAALLRWEEPAKDKNAEARENLLEQYRQFLLGSLTAEFDGNWVVFSDKGIEEYEDEFPVIIFALTDIDGDELPELQIKEEGTAVMGEDKNIYTVYSENGGLKMVKAASGGWSDSFTLYTNGLLWTSHGLHLPQTDWFSTLQGEKIACFVDYVDFVDSEDWEATVEEERRRWQEEGYGQVYVTYDGDTAAAEYTPVTFGAEYGGEEATFYSREEFLNYDLEN